MANLSATILADTSVSTSLQLGPLSLYAVRIPSNWTAAPISFIGQIEGGLLSPVCRDGNEVVVPVTAGGIAKLNPDDFAGLEYVQVRSGSGGAPVEQLFSVVLVMAAQ